MSAMPSTVRRALASEARILARLHIRAREQAMPWLPTLHTPEETEAWMTNIVLPGLEVWVAELASEVVGYMALMPGSLDQLYVDPDHHGRGHGGQLLRLAQEQNLRLELHVFQRNQRARRFYERYGFRLVSLGDGSDNEEREPDALYRWTHPEAHESSV